MVQIGQFLFIDHKTTDKLEFTAWFEVNWSFDSGDRTILILDVPLYEIFEFAVIT